MDETLLVDDDRTGKISVSYTRPNAISFGSQMLAVGAGFCVFIMLLAMFAAFQHRKRRRSSAFSGGGARSPLIYKHSFGGGGGARGQPRLSQAIPPPPAPQYLRCSNQNLRKCSSPGGSDYSLSSSYSSSAGSAHSLSPMSPYQSTVAGYQQSPFSGLNFIPYGHAAPPPPLPQKRHSNPTAPTGHVQLLGGGQPGAAPELVPNADGSRGTVSLQLAYDPANLALQVTVLACNGLPKFAGNSTPLNPYIKLRLLPEGQHRVKTRILRDTRDPVFDESFTMYGLSGETIRNSRLHLAALAFDRYNGDTVLGEAICDLAEFHAEGMEPKYVSLKWETRSAFEGQKLGKALVGISYDANTRAVKFSLQEMKDLPRDATLGLLDPYAKVYALLNGQKRVAKLKTRVARRTQHPVWAEERMEFTLPDSVGMEPHSGVPHALSFHVVLFNHEGVKRNEPIGQFTVDAESELFSAAFQQGAGREIGAEWHTLLPL